MEIWVAIVTTLVGGPSLAVLVTAWISRRVGQLSVDKAQADMRLELHKEVKSVRDELRAEQRRNDSLAELLDQRERTNREVVKELQEARGELREAQTEIRTLQEQLVIATTSVTALTTEASHLRERVRVLEQAG